MSGKGKGKGWSEFVSSVGKLGEFMTALAHAVSNLGGNADECLRLVVTSADVRNSVAQVLVDAWRASQAQVEPAVDVARRAVAKPILRLIQTVQVTAVERFVTREHIKEANVGWMGNNFKAHFLDKQEDNVQAGELNVHRLEQASLDPPMMAELGEKATISLAHFFQLLTAQSQGQEGALLTDGSANIAYIRGKDGNVRAVRACWDSVGGYWRVYAVSVENRDGWNAGDRVLSCK